MTGRARLALAMLGALAAAPAGAQGPDEMAPLAAPGDPARGRTIVLSPLRGNCAICHAVPGEDARFHGDLGPPLAGAGARWNAAQLRLRVADGRRLNPDSIMPAYHRTQGLVRVARPYAGRPVLTAEEIEDVVAYLSTLR
jgi:sulfur-oxidizing protein SoxX